MNARNRRHLGLTPYGRSEYRLRLSTVLILSTLAACLAGALGIACGSHAVDTPRCVCR